ncbi:MAG: hypothetical protein QM809_09425 [Gordonia sp. (in: high G+C Gram-positive bacteria)]|uniref:hypothetical protein n=1 Tax=Gordonia sp. (in: high G+C Gram-positive bacteria) TaxID=84139 RepID=UPI0039E5575A
MNQEYPTGAAGAPVRIEARRRLVARDVLLLMVIPLVFVVIGVALIATGDVLRGAPAVVFFGGGAVTALVIKRRDAVPLILDEAGVRNGRGTLDLSWDQIRGVHFRVQRAGRLDHRWLAIDSPVPGRFRVLSGLSARLVGIPQDAAQHAIPWDADVSPGIEEVAAAFRSYGVPVDGA